MALFGCGTLEKQLLSHSANRGQFGPWLQRGRSSGNGAVCQGIGAAGMNGYARPRQFPSSAGGWKHSEPAPPRWLALSREPFETRVQATLADSSRITVTAAAEESHAELQQPADAPFLTLQQMVHRARTLVDAQESPWGPVGYHRLPGHGHQAYSQADALAAQRKTTGQSAAAAEYALRDQQPPKQEAGDGTEVLVRENQLQQQQSVTISHFLDAVDTAAGLQQRLHEDAAAAHQPQQLRHRLLDLEQRLGEAAAGERAALAAKQQAQDQLAAAQALHTQQQAMLQQELVDAAKEHAAGFAELDAQYNAKAIEAAALKGQKQQQAAELRQAMVEIQLLRISERNLQQQLQQQQMLISQQQNTLQQRSEQLKMLHEKASMANEVTGTEHKSSSRRGCANQPAEQASSDDEQLHLRNLKGNNSSVQAQMQETKAAAAPSHDTHTALHAINKQNQAAVNAPQAQHASSPKRIPPATQTLVPLAPAAATAEVHNNRDEGKLVGLGLSMAMPSPSVDELHRAQQAEAELQAAKSKLSRLLGLLAATEAAILQKDRQAIALQERMCSVGRWRGLLAQAWQLHQAEEDLARELVQLQQAEEQQQLEVGCHQQNVHNGLKHTESHLVCHGLADLVSCDGGAALPADTSRCKEKTGQLLVALAERQSQLARLTSHVERLAAVQMAGSTEALSQLQQQLEGKLQQIDESRKDLSQMSTNVFECSMVQKDTVF